MAPTEAAPTAQRGRLISLRKQVAKCIVESLFIWDIHSSQRQKNNLSPTSLDVKKDEKLALAPDLTRKNYSTRKFTYMTYRI